MLQVKVLKNVDFSRPAPGKSYGKDVEQKH